jgi:hypothetical protein
MHTNSKKKLNIFTQAVDQCYTSKEEFIDYYSYEGCNTKDIDKMLNKSKITEADDEIQADNSTAGMFSDEETRVEKTSFTKNFLADDWTTKLKSLKDNTIYDTPSSNPIPRQLNPVISGRKLIFDSIPNLLNKIDLKLD